MLGLDSAEWTVRRASGGWLGNPYKTLRDLRVRAGDTLVVQRRGLLGGGLLGAGLLGGAHDHVAQKPASMEGAEEEEMHVDEEGAQVPMSSTMVDVMDAQLSASASVSEDDAAPTRARGGAEALWCQLAEDTITFVKKGDAVGYTLHRDVIARKSGNNCYPIQCGKCKGYMFVPIAVCLDSNGQLTVSRDANDFLSGPSQTGFTKKFASLCDFHVKAHCGKDGQAVRASSRAIRHARARCSRAVWHTRSLYPCVPPSLTHAQRNKVETLAWMEGAPSALMNHAVPQSGKVFVFFLSITLPNVGNATFHRVISATRGVVDEYMPGAQQQCLAWLKPIPETSKKQLTLLFPGMHVANSGAVQVRACVVYALAREVWEDARRPVFRDNGGNNPDSWDKAIAPFEKKAKAQGLNGELYYPSGTDDGIPNVDALTHVPGGQDVSAAFTVKTAAPLVRSGGKLLGLTGQMRDLEERHYFDYFDNDGTQPQWVAEFDPKMIAKLRGLLSKVNPRYAKVHLHVCVCMQTRGEERKGYDIRMIGDQACFCPCCPAKGEQVHDKYTMHALIEWKEGEWLLTLKCEECKRDKMYNNQALSVVLTPEDAARVLLRTEKKKPEFEFWKVSEKCRLRADGRPPPPLGELEAADSGSSGTVHPKDAAKVARQNQSDSVFACKIGRAVERAMSALKDAVTTARAKLEDVAAAAVDATAANEARVKHVTAADAALGDAQTALTRAKLAARQAKTQVNNQEFRLGRGGTQAEVDAARATANDAQTLASEMEAMVEHARAAANAAHEQHKEVLPPPKKRGLPLLRRSQPSACARLS